MAGLSFSTGLVEFLADHRSDGLTELFQLATFLGEVEGYVLLVSLVYVVYDKGLAFRLAALTLVAMSLNHVLKMLIMNPRPFIAEGTYAEKWAVSPERAGELAGEFSTPSGHAMAGAGRKALRLALTAAMVIGTLLGLDAAFGAWSGDASPLGHLLRFVRYALAGFAGLFLAPLLFVKLRLAERVRGLL